MNKSLFVLVLLISLVASLPSCKDDDNSDQAPSPPSSSSSLAVTVNGVEKQFIDFYSEKSLTGRFTMTGSTSDGETLTFDCAEFIGEAQYVAISGLIVENAFTYTNSSGTVFITSNGGSGVLNIIDVQETTISGDFTMTAVGPNSTAVTIEMTQFSNISFEETEPIGLESTLANGEWSDPDAILIKDQCLPGSYLIRSTYGASLIQLITPYTGNSTLVYIADTMDMGTIQTFRNDPIIGALSVSNVSITSSTISGAFEVDNGVIQFSGSFDGIIDESVNATSSSDNYGSIGAYSNNSAIYRQTNLDIVSASSFNGRIGISMVDACGSISYVEFPESAVSGDEFPLAGPTADATMRNYLGNYFNPTMTIDYGPTPTISELEVFEHDPEAREVRGKASAYIYDEPFAPYLRIHFDTSY